MGTRADFYVGRGKAAEWIGSIAFDGYPEGVPADVRTATTEGNYRAAVADLLDRRDDATLSEQGWPWPWGDSGTTDYSYAFDGDHVYGTSWGYVWFDAREPEPEEPEEGWRTKAAEFPDMTDRKKVVDRGPRSGMMVVSFGPKGLTVE